MSYTEVPMDHNVVALQLAVDLAPTVTTHDISFSGELAD
jgi:hypothetical protein